MRHHLFYMYAVSKLINNRTRNSRSEWGWGEGGTITISTTHMISKQKKHTSNRSHKDCKLNNSPSQEYKKHNTRNANIFSKINS